MVHSLRVPWLLSTGPDAYVVTVGQGGFDEGMTETVLDGALDLLLGGSCVGCARPGRLLCPACQSEIPGRAAPAWPTPTPAGLVEPWAASVYEGTVRAMVLGLKERRLLGLAVPLARLLAAAVSCELPLGSPVVLVPVPSRPRTVRARGHDPTRTITVRAARQLRSEGFDVAVHRLLRLRAGVVDQAGLDATERAANLSGSMQARAVCHAQVRAQAPGGPIGGLRRRADQRLDGARGPARPRGGRPRGGPGGGGGGHPPPVRDDRTRGAEGFLITGTPFRVHHWPRTVGTWRPPEDVEPGGLPGSSVLRSSS